MYIYIPICEYNTYTHSWTYIHTHTHTYIYIYIYIHTHAARNCSVLKRQARSGAPGSLTVGCWRCRIRLGQMAVCRAVPKPEAEGSKGPDI